jgi:hypothetical protein
MSQLAIDFNATALARREDPETSKAAAAEAATFLARHLALILSALKTGSKTKDEIAAVTRLDHIAVARRMKQGEDRGLWRRTDKTRPSRAGRQETVWEAI